MTVTPVRASHRESWPAVREFPGIESQNRRRVAKSAMHPGSLPAPFRTSDARPRFHRVPPAIPWQLHPFFGQDPQRAVVQNDRAVAAGECRQQFGKRDLRSAKVDVGVQFEPVDVRLDLELQVQRFAAPAPPSARTRQFRQSVRTAGGQVAGGNFRIMGWPRLLVEQSPKAAILLVGPCRRSRPACRAAKQRLAVRLHDGPLAAGAADRCSIVVEQHFGLRWILMPARFSGGRRPPESAWATPRPLQAAIQVEVPAWEARACPAGDPPVHCSSPAGDLEVVVLGAAASPRDRRRNPGAPESDCWRSPDRRERPAPASFNETRSSSRIR